MKCLSVAMIPVLSRPRTYADAIVPTRYGILADRLLDSSPAWVDDNVEHRRQPLMDADRTHAPPDARSHLLDQLWIERRSPRERNRVGGRAPGGEAGQALLVSNGGDPKPAGLGNPTLCARQ